MYLDIRTLQVSTLVICSVLGPVSLAFAPSQPDMRPSRFWGAGLIALAAAMALFSLRGYGPEYIHLVIAPSAAALALTFSQTSARCVLGRAGRDTIGLVLLGAYAAALLLLEHAPGELWLRQPVTMCGLGGLACRVAYGFDRGRRTIEHRPLRLIGGIFGLIGLATILNGLSSGTAVHPTPEREMTEGLLLVGLMAGLLLGTILLMWVMAERISGRIRALVSLDPLTGVLNRASFIEHFEREASRVRRRPESCFGILLINIDHFRRINDAYGHLACDRVLARIGELLRKTVRGYDVVGRLEGDAFVLLMPGARQDTVASMGERVRAVIEHQAASQTALKNPLTASIGIALFGDHGDDWGAMMRAADTAAKSAKALGRNRVEIAPLIPGAATAAPGGTDPVASA